MKTHTIALSAIVSLLGARAVAQNLVVNPTFDRDLAGWTQDMVSTQPPGANSVQGSIHWGPLDSSARPGSGSALFSFTGPFQSAGGIRLSQCVPVHGGSSYLGGGRFRIDRQRDATIAIVAGFFEDPGCPGPLSAGSSFVYGSQPLGEVWALGSMCLFANDTMGAWVERSFLIAAPAAARSARLSVVIENASSFYCGGSSVDGKVDDVVFLEAEPPSVRWLLPASAHLPGAHDSFWTTDLWLANSADAEGLADLTFLGHDVDGRGRPAHRIRVPARGVTRLADALATLSSSEADYGAILAVLSAHLTLVAENSTPSCGEGAVGELLPALGPSDLIGAGARSIFPIRQNERFRTNLALVNATEHPLAVRLRLFSAEGAPLGEDEIELPPLGMTQRNEVAASLGAFDLDGGRLELFTPTTDGTFVAYASLIDNGTNDPRALLPR